MVLPVQKVGVIDSKYKDAEIEHCIETKKGQLCFTGFSPVSWVQFAFGEDKK